MHSNQFVLGSDEVLMLEVEVGLFLLLQSSFFVQAILRLDFASFALGFYSLEFAILVRMLSILIALWVPRLG